MAIFNTAIFHKLAINDARNSPVPEFLAGLDSLINTVEDPFLNRKDSKEARQVLMDAFQEKGNVSADNPECCYVIDNDSITIFGIRGKHTARVYCYTDKVGQFNRKLKATITDITPQHIAFDREDPMAIFYEEGETKTQCIDTANLIKYVSIFPLDRVWDYIHARRCPHHDLKK